MYSLYDAIGSPDDIIAKAKELGYDAIALTDHAALYGIIEFYEAAQKAGIKPILGVDAYLATNLHTDKRAGIDNRTSRIVLLVENNEGYQNLLKLVSTSFLEGFYYKPRMDKELLRKHHAGLIALSGGLKGDIPQALHAHDMERAEKLVAEYKEIFGPDHFFLEAVWHPESPTQNDVNELMFELAAKTNTKVVAAKNVHYLHEEDREAQDVLVCIHDGKTVDDQKRTSMTGIDLSLTPIDPIVEAFKDHPEAIENTRIIADRCDVKFELGKNHLPRFDLPEGDTEPGYLRKLCEVGILERYSGEEKLKEANERLEFELATIERMGFAAYFLIVSDYINWAKDHGVIVGPGRGSAAGSIVAYALRITNLDPLRYGLLFERFLNPDRISMPDIDTDFDDVKRKDVIQYVMEKYGHNRVAGIITFGTMAARAAVRDVGRALGMSYADVDRISKVIPPPVQGRHIPLDKSKDEAPELRAMYYGDPRVKRLVDLAVRLEGTTRHASQHACGIVISPRELVELAPLQKAQGGDVEQVVQYSLHSAEAMGLLKMDFLGLSNLSVIRDCLEIAKAVYGADIDMETIPLDDPKTFELIQSTKTLGLFQIESPGQRELIGKFAPETFTDLIIDISLFRPGPVKSDMIKPFLNARHGWKSPQIFHPDLYEALHETEGVVVFHEQVIRIISTLTGISFAEADEKRRALSSPEGQQEVCDWFYPAALSKGYQLPVVTEIWEVLRAFASFGFCKAHAAAFALPTYQSAWLKTHYPAAFLAGVLTHDPGMYPKRLMMDEVRQLGIGIGVVDVNHSTRNHRVEVVGGRESIRLALQDISGISDGEITSIENGQPYLDLADFVRRSGASQPICEALVLIGGFDSLHNGLNRRDLLLNVNDLYRWSRSATRLGGGQLTLGFTPELEASGLPKMTKREKVSYELDHLGMDVSHHVIEFYAAFLNEIGAVRSSELLAQRSESSVLVAGIKVALQTPPVRSGRRVIFLTLNDGYGCSDITFFEDMQSSYAQLLYGSSLFLIRGIIRRTGARGISLRATGAWELSAEFEKWRNLTVCER